MRVALVHDWLTGMRGGERVLEELIGLFPDCEIHALVHVPGSVSKTIEGRPIRTSVLDRIPGGRRHFRALLPWFPHAVSTLRPRSVDLVISDSHAVAKSVPVPPGVPHLCYCHTPMRYVWDRYDDYFGPGRASAFTRAVMPAMARRLRRWDVETAGGVTAFVANSAHVRDRIRRAYGRDAAVVHPPVDVSRFTAAPVREDFYLVLGALVPYKRVDVAVDAFRRMDRRLVVAGGGPEAGRLRARAGEGVEFLGPVSDADVADLLGRCRALVFAGVEDFGMVPVEAQAAGAPVIAYAAGGALETVIAPGTEGRPPTGVLFDEQTPEALADAVARFETLTFNAAAVRANAERFRPERFRRGILEAVERVLGGSVVA